METNTYELKNFKDVLLEFEVGYDNTRLNPYTLKIVNLNKTLNSLNNTALIDNDYAQDEICLKELERL